MSPKIEPEELLDWLMERTNDPAEQLTALCEATAEILKTAPTPQSARDFYIRYLDKFLTVPNRYLEPTRPARSQQH